MTPSSTPTPYTSTYERMSGNSTRFIPAHIVSTISPPITSSSYVLDNACGPGIVSEQIKLRHPDARIMATDLSPAMIEETERRIEAESWSNMRTGILDTWDLDLRLDKQLGKFFQEWHMEFPSVLLSTVLAHLFHLATGVNDNRKLEADCNRSRLAHRLPQLRPQVTSQNGMAQDPEVMRGSWLLKQLEDAGFGNNVELRPFLTHTSAASLDELVDNLMLAKPFFFAGCNDEELSKAKALFRVELRKLSTFEERMDGVRIGMRALIGVGWKRDDGQGEGGVVRDMSGQGTSSMV
ncbi:hypothetical protein MMC11_004930 [Xylographa trunciseda]|nr:hypothetical protein [Xylographa trunciseda]